MIPYGRQVVGDDDVAGVVEVLHGDWLTQGPSVDAFESELAARVGAAHAVAFSNGTAALHAAAAAAGVGPGDTVATSALTFAASAACATYVGATPVSVDIDESTLNMDLRRVPADADAVVVVHYAGLPADLRTLERRPRVVIEDAAHALGASTPDGPVGNCARSDMCCFSFHPVKAMTTGEGGAVTTNDPGLAERLRRFRHHGIEHQPDEGPWAYEIGTLGFNYRLTDIQAALGRTQLRKLDGFVARRRQLAARYDELLEGVCRLPPRAPAGSTHAYHLYPVQVPERRRVYDALRAAGIGVQVHYVPVYRHQAYFPPGLAKDHPVTEAVYSRLLSIPLHPGLTDADQDRVVAAMVRSLG